MSGNLLTASRIYIYIYIFIYICIGALGNCEIRQQRYSIERKLVYF